MQYQQHEIDKFNNLAHEWWNLDGEFKTLHQINPIRLDFIKKHVQLENAKIIDIGCGGGILAESLAKNGALVTGIDLAPQSIETAKLHLYESHLNIDYQCIDIAKIAEKYPNSFDVVSCMEMLEHVSEPEIIIANCAKLLKPNGVAFFSTLNRTLKSYALGVITAEYILKIIPKGTHNYAKFIKPSELCHMLSKYNLTTKEIQGINYNPINGKTSINNNVDINYIVVAHN
jgi:2-polyprenyl-6-hydroxyphenyl methylase / 3-demethylubiquinone-9 3-methyltransferase